MLHHLTLWVPDVERAAGSWRWLLCDHLGYTLEDGPGDRILLFRHEVGFTLVLEQSDDMVPGMLHSRFRPGLNHVALSVDGPAVLERILADAAEHGWSSLPVDRHPIAGRAEVAYLEDRDGFEVELVVSSATTTSGEARPARD